MTVRTTTLALGAFLAAGLTLAAEKPNKKKNKPDAAAATPAARPADPVKVPAEPINVAEAAGLIDRHINEKLAAEKVAPSPRSDDAEFARRTSLDVTGTVPAPEAVKAFLDSTDPAKRAKWVDGLLASDRYGEHLADGWTAMLFPRTSDNRRLAPDRLHDWFTAAFNENRPWDRVAADLVTATGDVDENGAGLFFVANPTPDKMTDEVAKAFLGVRLECAQCHNHPFTDWKQADYWHMAAFFLKVRTGKANALAKRGEVPSVQEVNGDRRSKVNELPESAKLLPPKFLLGDKPNLPAAEPYRPAFARWMTDPANPFFARAMVNRTWAQFFGRGFVNPIDDMHDDNPASHPELLAELAARFAAGGFDLKQLVRAVCASEAYQRTSKPAAGNESDKALFSHMAVKVLSPEQLFDSLTAVLGEPDAGREAARRKLAEQKKAPANNPKGAFVAFFGIEEGADPTEYHAGIPQALRLMNSPKLSRSPKLSKLPESVPAAVEQVYLTALSRRPTGEELKKLTAYVAGQPNKAAAYGDVVWAVLNSSEFAVNR